MPMSYRKGVDLNKAFQSRVSAETLKPIQHTLCGVIKTESAVFSRWAMALPAEKTKKRSGVEDLGFHLDTALPRLSDFSKGLPAALFPHESTSLPGWGPD